MFFSGAPILLNISPGALYGGGFFMRFAFSADGSAKYVTYDSGNTGYQLNGASWRNVNNATLAPTGFSNWLAGVGRINEFSVPPTNSSVVIAITGTKILKSTDACATPWADTGLSITSGISSPRGHGPVCAFDPANENVAFFIKTNGSVFRTEDQFVTLPAASGDPGITSSTAGSVAFDPTSGTATINSKTVTKGIYFGFYSGATGVYESLDGATFNLTTGGPARVFQWSMSPDGVLYAIDAAFGTGNVWRYVTPTSTSGLSSGWTNLSMTSGSTFNSVAADPLNAGHMVALMSSGNIVYSTDYGTTPISVGQPGTHRAATDTAWMQTWAGGLPNVGTNENSMTNGSCIFDPVVSGLLWICEGIGVWRWDSTASPSLTIHSLSSGLGGIIVDQILQLPNGPLVMTVQDRVAFVFNDPKVAPVGDIGIGDAGGGVHNGWGLDYAKDGSGFVVMSVDGGLYTGTVSGGNLAMSLLTSSIGGQAMLACQTSSKIVVNVNGNNFKYTIDGSTFNDSLFAGVPLSYGWGNFFNNYNAVVASDTDASTYYAFNRGKYGVRSISSITNAGSGYAANDTILLKGGTNSGGTASYTSIIKVLTVDGGGAILTAEVIESGLSYSIPSNPIGQQSTTGAGTGATFNISYSDNSGTWKTTDSGANWTQLSTGLITANAVTMASGSSNAQMKKYSGGPYLLYGNGTTFNTGNFPCCIGVEAAGAVTWSAIKGITKGWQIDAGPSAPVHSNPSIVFTGLCSTDADPTVPGVFIADDFDPTNLSATPTWRRISTAPNGNLDGPRTLACHPLNYGVVYWGYDATGFGGNF